MTLKSWKDVARDIQATTAAQPPGAPAVPTPGPAELLDAAAANPNLKRLLQERERLVRKMNEIVQGAPGNFTAHHDNVRFPVEPLRDRRASDARWTEARDKTRSAAVRRILEARRRDVSPPPTDAPPPDWTLLRDRQLQEASKQARSLQSERAEQVRALDARIERAREDLRTTVSRTTVSVLEQRDRGQDWPTSREQQRARALDKARMQIVEKVMQEQALDRRLDRARENRLASLAPSASERREDWQAERDRRLPGAPDRPRAPTSAEPVRSSRRDESGREIALDRRREGAHEKPLGANRTARKTDRTADVLGRAERVVDGLRQLDKSLDRIDGAFQDTGAGNDLARLDRARSGLGKALSLADKVEAPLRRAQDRQEIWQAKRDRAREELRQFKSFQDSNRRKLSVDAGSIDQLTALRDMARELWPNDRDKKKDAQKEQKTWAERAKDLDERRKQALARLTAKRDEDQRHERRRERGLMRRKSEGGGFRGE